MFHSLIEYCRFICLNQFQFLLRFHGTIECLIALFGIPDKSKTKESIERQLEDVDVPLFNLLTITIATNNFLLKNKIGQGGFGPVYKVIQYLRT